MTFSTRRLELNLGPGDTAFVRGFAADAEVEEKVGWRWTTYDATIDLPFQTEGSEAQATLRYARVFGEEAVVDVEVGGSAAGQFRARGGEVRSTTLGPSSVSGPLIVRIKVDSHERRNMGLKMDTLSLDAVSGSAFKLRLSAALRPVVCAVALFSGLLTLGGSPLAAGSAALFASLAFAYRASLDLFGAWRQTSLVPEMLVVSTLVLGAGRWWLEKRMRVEENAVRVLALGALGTMVFRLVLVSHPDFYYPDLLTHARVAQAMANEGPSFFLHPADALNAQGAWTKPVMGRSAALPYAVMFHTPFATATAALSLSTDQIETLMKAGAVLLSVLPVLICGALAPRLSLPPLSALMLCLVPTYTSRLSFALLPALLGHAFDLVVILAVLVWIDPERRDRAGSALGATAILLVGHLAYTSSVVNEAVLMGALSAVALASGRAFGPLAARLVLAETAAALLAFLLYYRHFVDDVFALARGLAGLGPGAEGGPASVYAIESFWTVLFERTNTFFGWPYFALAVLGLYLGGPALRRSLVMRAWGLAYLALILLRAKIPDVFRYGHETLFLTPLIALLSGSALLLAWRRAGVLRWAALGAGVLLVGWSGARQWMAVHDQLRNAL